MSREHLSTPAWGMAVLVGLSIGCQATENVWLVQPRLQSWQRELKLQSVQVRWAGAGDESVERVLAEFPLPGARTGRATYLLYLRLPVGAEQVSFQPEAAPQGRGFLIQTRGEYAGLARATSGSVERKSGSSTGKRSYRIDLTFEDDSHLVGEIQASRDEYYVSQFENQGRPADVARLIAYTGDPATSPNP